MSTTTSIMLMLHDLATPDNYSDGAVRKVEKYDDFCDLLQKCIVVKFVREL